MLDGITHAQIERKRKATVVMARSSETSSEVVQASQAGQADNLSRSRSGDDTVLIERRRIALSALAAGGRWRRMVRWIGLALFSIGALLLAYVFWQAFSRVQKFSNPGYLSSQFNHVAGDDWQSRLQAVMAVLGTEVLYVFYLLLMGFLASAIASKGIQFFSASEAIIDEAVVGDIE
jgi:hypothetical protein